MTSKKIDLLTPIIDAGKEKTNRLIEANVALSVFADELDLFSDMSLRDFVKGVLFYAYDHRGENESAFWVSPSSLIPAMHPPDEYDEGGMVLHTKRVARMAVHMAYTIAMSKRDIDMLLAAALLHDITKAIYTDDEGNFSHDSMHSYTIDLYIGTIVGEEMYDSDNILISIMDLDIENRLEIIRIIHCAHGIFSPIQETIPIAELEKILAMADYCAANLHTLYYGSPGDN